MSEALRCPFPVLGVAAWSGTGKTTLLEQLLPLLRGMGVSVAVIKHAHHHFDVDQPGKDSYRLRSSGAAPMLIASRHRYALMQETPGQEEPDLAHLLALMAPHSPDLVIVEGFKAWPIPKLALYREGIGDPAILSDPWVQAAALTGEPPVKLASSVTRLDLNRCDAIARWVSDWADQQRRNLA
ncbi:MULTISPECIES: molybdopterin-guanine dinucleotide biosynthesis protein B [Halomonadaceae]|jgi:molybdopterin-guanine dinucleotide biosynthesis protein B|uniref:molybdopterin-guanine dinucleotide biosynthesis protein B n=1 Tax=Halomonadaceae TaxID=28256 RepID=UPI00111900A8|nr:MULTISPECIES: molybdopterin-guanine dinucleotide biosynthesis protein B [Halomonas]MCG7591226.1 molybdopterin-guanine dinucleotide biosynthesis protein B [Halomonas sp. McD50-5]MCG7617406.1 molybdopterin-guanine dinucleotide biosynthesis protein B [Halomonas sp. McD50-4]TNH14550.1 molybdopterin-guanine dinucleotide biosynthesis protein B [Halomonas sp. BL6]BCB62042.1 molybdopterin-guanine dinucleotide biosynthesis protein B [Halomonas sp. A020]